MGIEKHDRDIHDYCGIAKKTPAELTHECAQAMERKDLALAMHCAHHHLKLCHGGVHEKQIEFFYEKLTPVIATGQTSVVDGAKVLKEHIEARFDEVSERPEMKYVMQQATHWVALETGKAMMVPYVLGISTAMYVATKGEGCLFSLIDPELCKEAMG